MKPVLILIGVVVLLALVRFGIPLLNPPNDQALIEESLTESIEASKEGRPGGVMDKLSDRFRINNTEPGSRSQIANFIKNSRPEVSVENKQAVITGDVATISTPVRIQLDWLGQRMDRELNDVTLTFRKEEAIKYLIFPTRKWRLAEVNVSDQAVYEFLQ